METNIGTVHTSLYGRAQNSSVCLRVYNSCSSLWAVVCGAFPGVVLHWLFGPLRIVPFPVMEKPQDCVNSERVMSCSLFGTHSFPPVGR